MDTITISEYGSLIAGKKNGEKINGYTTMKQEDFLALEKFILEAYNRDADATQLMTLSIRKGVGKIITAKNYVGVLSLKDGTTVEILPKVYSGMENADEAKARQLLIRMLRTLRNTPFKTLQTASVDTDRLNVFEIFIRMFLDEVFFITKRGLKRNYEAVQENATFYKGKMIFSQQLKHNHTHKERSYVEYDAFTLNRPENRILKLTLQYLYSHSASSRNRIDLKMLLNAFGEIPASVDVKGDFSRYIPDRNMADYSTALMWSRIFLSGKSFTSFSGSEVAVALLFPMETLFESYIAAMLKKQLNQTLYSVSVQDKTYHLFDEPRRFAMRPDIVIRRKTDNAVFVLDTKWKILSESKANFGISQDDMYQMFAYQKKYNADCVTLIYPVTDLIDCTKPIVYQSKDGVTVQICFVDCMNIKDSLSNLLDI